MALNPALPNSSLSQDLQHDALFASFGVILFMLGEGFKMTLMFLDISIPINGSISISFSSVESVSPTYRGEIGRVCVSALLTIEHYGELTRSSWKQELGWTSES